MNESPDVRIPAQAEEIFGSGVAVTARFARILAGAGVERGLLGPREVDRIWDRHLINCAVVGEVVPEGAQLLDLGSGAGLPGIVLAIDRPDLHVTLLEPLLRRTTFLDECVAALELDNVTVLRGRAEERAGRMSVDVVTARAVAPLSRLADWALPLLRPDGVLLALKGDRAAEEMAEADTTLRRHAVRDARVVQVGQSRVKPATTIVRVVAGAGRKAAKGRKR